MIHSREFEFSDVSFNRIRQFVLEQTGIVLGHMKKDMVYGRLAKHLRTSEIEDFEQFCDEIDSGNQDEQEFLINAITTNLTSFFRENHHFEYLATKVLPELILKNKESKRLRIWSAGCSTGEEAYSIAMILKESLLDFEEWDVKILATDLDANVLTHAAKSVYQADSIIDMDEARLSKWFKYGRNEHVDQVKVKDELQDIIRFKRLNLWIMAA